MIVKNALFVLTSVLLLSAESSFAGTAGTLKWPPISTGGRVAGSPAVGPTGLIYITSEDGFLYGINPTTFGLAWAPFPLGGAAFPSDEIIASPSVGPDGSVYAAWIDAGGNPSIFSVNPNGTLNWPLPVNIGGYDAVAFATNGTIYATGDDVPNLVAAKPSADNSSGNIQWTLNLYTDIGVARVNSAPTVGPDGTIYLIGDVNNEQMLVAIGDENCTAGVRWTVDLGFSGDDVNDFNSTMVFDNVGRVYAPYGPGSTSLMAFNTADGSPAWNWPFTPPNGGSIKSSPAIAADGTVYIGATDGYFYGLKSDGTQKWAPFNTQITDPAAPIHSSPAIASDGTIVFGSDDGRLWCVKDYGTSVAQQWAFPPLSSQALTAPIRSSPLIAGADNTIYFGCDDGNIYAVYGSAGLANSFWPKFRRDAAGSASASTNVQSQEVWVGGTITWMTNIYKGLTGFGIPEGGSTKITLSRGDCSGAYNSLMVTFLLGGGGDVFSTPYYDYISEWAYDGLDFTVSNCTKAPFPHGFYVIFQPGQTQITIEIQAVDSVSYNGGEAQSLLFIIPPNQPGSSFGVNPEGAQATIYVYPDPNLGGD